MSPEQILKELIHLAHEVGREDRQLVILGEGNLSADCQDGTFWVKASGSSMAEIDENGFSRVRFEPVLEMCTWNEAPGQQVMQGLRGALLEDGMRQPSIETFLHAVCLHESEAKFIAHTHPTAVLAILSSKLGAESFMHHIFPETIPICGRAPAIVPYTEPGLMLGQAVRRSLQTHFEKYGEMPKIMLMENHGLVVLGISAREALNITRITNKWADILLATYALGGPKYLSSEQVDKFLHLLDEQIHKDQ